MKKGLILFQLQCVTAIGNVRSDLPLQKKFQCGKIGNIQRRERVMGWE